MRNCATVERFEVRPINGTAETLSYIDGPGPRLRTRTLITSLSGDSPGSGRFLGTLSLLATGFASLTGDGQSGTVWTG